MDNQASAKTNSDPKKGSNKIGVLLITVLAVFIVGSFIFSANDKKADVPPKSAELLPDTAYERIVAEKKSTKVSSDAEAVKRLSKLATFKKDEYKGITWIKPKAKPAYVNMNGLYCYFSKEGNEVSNFRFVIQYFSDDWLFVQNYRFIIDGEPFTYTPSKVERDNGDGDIWEWSDENVSGADVALIEALAKAKSAKIRFEGSQYYKEKTITSGQLKSIKDMYALYKAMGGTL